MSSWTEKLVLFGAPNALSGILTTPATSQDGLPRTGAPAVLFLNAGILHRVGPNRMHVELARLLTTRGHTSLRFDLSGIGDSRPRSDGLGLGDGVRCDVDAALEVLRAAGHARIIVVGLCSGADNALRAGARDPSVVGLVQLDPTIFRTPTWYIHRFARQCTDPAAWRRWMTSPRLRASLVRTLRRTPTPTATSAEGRPEFFYTGFRTREELEAHLQPVVARRTQLFYAFTGGWAEHVNYRTQLLDNHPHINFEGLVELRHYPEADHTYSARHLRETFFQDLVRWFASAPFPAP